MWLDPATYLPIKIAVEIGTGRAMQLDHTEYTSWLPPAPAALAELTRPVPAGFVQIPPPPALSCQSATPACLSAAEKKVNAWYAKYLAPRK